MITGVAVTPGQVWEAWDRRCGFRIKAWTEATASEALNQHLKTCRCEAPPKVVPPRRKRRKVEILRLAL